MTKIRLYLLSLVAGAVFVSLCGQLMSKGIQRKTVSFIGNLVLILLVIAPLLSIRDAQIASALSAVRLEAEALRTGVEITNRDIQEIIIAEQCEAYILDRAQAMGADLLVKVQLSDKGGIPYPVCVELQGTCSPEIRQRLTMLLQQEFAVPEDNLIWSLEE